MGGLTETQRAGGRLEAVEVGGQRPAGVCVGANGGDWAGRSEESFSATSNFDFNLQVD